MENLSSKEVAQCVCREVAETACPVDIYNFSKNPQNLVFAAIFGYVPNLVLSILQSKSEDIKGQIKSVSPTDNSETVSKGNGIGSTAKAKIGK